MQDRHLCRPLFFLGPAVFPHFFNSRIATAASSPLHDTTTVNLDLVQCECHSGKWTVIARNTSINRNWAADIKFSRKFWFLVPISRKGQMPVLTPCRRPWFWRTTSSKLFSWLQCKSAPIIVILFAFTSSAAMLTSKVITGINENHSKFYACANSCSKCVSSGSW